MVMVCDKDKIKIRIIKNNKDHFSKAKCTKAHNDKMHDVMKENDTREKL